MNELPISSQLNAKKKDYDYIDLYAHTLKRKNTNSDDLFRAFFTSAPSWVDFLFKLRNSIVKLLGLKAEMADLRDIKPSCMVGQSYGIFTIFNKSHREVIMGTDDKHLDFRVSLLVDDSEKLIISTVVKFHNTLGRSYFSIVKHFHRFIVPSMIKRMAANLESDR